MVQPLWKAVCSLFKELKNELSYDPVIPLWGIYLKRKKNPETLIQKNICTLIFKSDNRNKESRPVMLVQQRWSGQSSPVRWQGGRHLEEESEPCWYLGGKHPERDSNKCRGPGWEGARGALLMPVW